MPDRSPPPGQSAADKRKRRLLILENEQWRRRSAWWDELQGHVPEAAKSGFAAGQKSSWVNSLDYALIVVSILAALSEFTRYINWALGAYALLALVLRTPSRRVLAAGGLSLVLIPVSLVLQRQKLADDFAIMMLYFICVGLVRLFIEVNV